MKGATIRQRLEQVGVTQTELARLLDIKPQSLQKILNASNVLSGTVERICEALELPISFFYTEETQPEAVEITGDTAKIWETSRLAHKVKALLKEQHKKMKSLCSYVGMTPPGMYRVFERDTCNITVLMKMSEYFGVPLTHFLPENKRDTAEAEKDKEIQFLRGQVKAYETALSTLLANTSTTLPFVIQQGTP